LINHALRQGNWFLVEPILGPSSATSLEEPRIVLEENQQFADSRKQTSDPSSLPDAGPYDFGALSALIGIRMLSVGDKKKATGRSGSSSKL